MADPNKVTVYCDSYLTSSAAGQLANGAFGTVVLPLPRVDDEMLRLNIRRLKSGLVRNVLFSLRGDEERSAVAHAIEYYAADGADLSEPVAEMVGFVASMGKLIVGSPSSEQDLWIEALKATGRQMSWWNLQLNHACEYAGWVCAIVASGAMRSEAAQSFVVPGYHAAWSTPEYVAYDIEGLRLSAAFLDGVFLRRYEDLVPRAAEWSRAVWSGLGQRVVRNQEAGMLG